MRSDQHPMEYAAERGVDLWDTYSHDELRDLRDSVDHGCTVYWDDLRLKRIVRLRLIGCNKEYPWWDVSYVYGELKDGTRCLVLLPVNRLRRNWRGHLVELAKKENVYAKGLGCFDSDVISTLGG